MNCEWMIFHFSTHEFANVVYLFCLMYGVIGCKRLENVCMAPPPLPPPLPKKLNPSPSFCTDVICSDRSVLLTRCALCPHFCRRHLRTNMAVRLCDVASLLRSGSWAAEPWTGVCGTSSSYLLILFIFISTHVIPVMANFLCCSALQFE